MLGSNCKSNLLHSRYYGWMRFFPTWIFFCPKRRNHSDVSLVNGEACWSCDQNIKPFSYKGDIILFFRPRLGKMTTLCFVFVPPFESWFCSECCDCDTVLLPLQDRRSLQTLLFLLRKDGREEGVCNRRSICRKSHHFHQLEHDYQSCTKKNHVKIVDLCGKGESKMAPTYPISYTTLHGFHHHSATGQSFRPIRARSVS